jgi:transcriptional regulator with XRE-family HTH domain
MYEAMGVGDRVRARRKALDLTQLDLASRVGVSESWLRGLEHGRQALTKHRVAVALANQLKVTVGWLYGQPFQPRRPRDDAGHAAVPMLRAALHRTSLILSGHPRISATEAPQPVTVLRRQVERALRDRQSAKLVELSMVLPDLVEDLNTGLLSCAGDELAEIRRLCVQVCHIARVVLNLLGFHDLAWSATECAALAAGQTADDLLRAESAWNRCGVLMHSGALPEAIAVAQAAMVPLEARLGRARDDEVAMWGALNLRCAISFGRAGAARDAEAHLAEAKNAGARLAPSFVDLRHQTVFCPTVVAIHEVELAVEVGSFQRALRRAPDLRVARLPSRERRTHHGIDVARAYAGVGADAEAVAALTDAARQAAHYVYHHPAARQMVVGLLLRDRPTARNAGLGALAHRMGIE